MGKTVIDSYGFLSKDTKCKATVVGSLNVGNTQQNTETVFTSSTNDDQLKHNERLETLSATCQDGAKCYRRCLRSRENSSDSADEMVKVLFPEFFTSNTGTRLEQTVNIFVENRFNDPIISSWMKLFGARPTSWENFA